MKKNIRVITINGFRGIVFALFIVAGLISGFVIAPSYACKMLWNFIGTNYVVLPHMEFYHGLILWLIIALSIYAICKNKVYVAVPMVRNFDEDKIKSILKEHAKMSFPERPELKMPEDENINEKVKK